MDGAGRRARRVRPRQPSRRRLLGGALAAAACAWSRPAVLAAAEPPLAFGLTPVFMTSDLEVLERLQAYLEAATGEPVQLVTRRTYQEITALLVSGQLDAAWICGYPFVQNHRELSLVAVPLWQGLPLYRSYIIVDAERPIEDWTAIAGDIHAFSDPDSNSGFLVTSALLAGRGQRPESFFRKSFFTYGHRNVVRAVAAGLAQSGSVDGYVWEVMRDMEPALTARTRVLHRSEPLGFPPVAAARLRSGGRRTAALAAALLTMHEQPLGQEVLALLRLDGFVPSEPALFDSIAERVALLRRLE